MTLGVNPDPDTTPVSVYPGTPPAGGLANPDTGNSASSDGSGRPLYPTVFVTDTTGNPSNKSGDWQQLSDNSTAKSPNTLFGTWKAATQSGLTITPNADPTKNNTNLGTGSDIPPGGFAQYGFEGYGSEAVWSASSLGLQAGHTYRLQFMVHDGDQNKTGGDVGQSCVNVSML